MKQNHLVFAVIVVLGIILISGCVQEEQVSEITDKEKCENSGGSWLNPCETGECYECNCMLTGTKNYRILKSEVCEDCKNDADCGENKCGMSRNQCIEHIYSCENGLCTRTTEYYSVWGGPRTHECIDNKCVSCEEDCVTR